MAMTYLDQVMMFGVLMVLLLVMAFCVGWVMWLVIGDPDAEQATDQADAMWQTIEDECRRMREAGIAN